MKTRCLIVLCCILIGCNELPLPSVHEQLRQHILEAELGSAITISFAKKPAIPLPSQQDANRRMWSAYRLGGFSNETAVNSLIRATQDLNSGVAGRAAAALVRINKISLSAVRKKLNHDVIQPRINSSRAPGTYLYAVPGYIGDRGDINKLEAIRAKDKKTVRVITESLQLIKKQDIKG